MTIRNYIRPAIRMDSIPNIGNIIISAKAVLAAAPEPESGVGGDARENMLASPSRHFASILQSRAVGPLIQLTALRCCTVDGISPSC
jgi:hypothetical protein